jgi:hypothetical protein
VFDTFQHEKLVNAINFFARNTKHCHTLKLFKLLNFLDFEHFRATGSGVTGLTYSAWPLGPVPPALFRELQRGGMIDLARSVLVVPITDDLTDKLLRRDIKALAPFGSAIFFKTLSFPMGGDRTSYLSYWSADTSGRDRDYNVSTSNTRNCPGMRFAAESLPE